MPRQPRFSKDDIVSAGLRIVGASGIEAVSARALGKELGTSSSPMFTMFKDMNEVMGLQLSKYNFARDCAVALSN